jgi:hypothetical protein
MQFPSHSVFVRQVAPAEYLAARAEPKRRTKVMKDFMVVLEGLLPGLGVAR